MSEWIRMLQVRGYNSNIRFGKFLLYEYIVPDNYNIKNILYIHRIFQKCTQIAGEILTQNMGEPPKPLLRTSREHICSKQWSRISTQNMFWNSKTNVLSICPALYTRKLQLFAKLTAIDFQQTDIVEAVRQLFSMHIRWEQARDLWSMWQWQSTSKRTETIIEMLARYTHQP